MATGLVANFALGLKLFVWTIAIILIFFFILLFINRKAGEKERVNIASNKIAISSIIIEGCDNIVKSGKIDEIIKRHAGNIISKSVDVKSDIHRNINKVIDYNFFERALSAKQKNNKEFNTIIKQAYYELADLSGLEKSIKIEYEEAVQEIKDLIIKWLRDEDIRSYLQINGELQRKIIELKSKSGSFLFFLANPELKDILTLDYEREIIKAAITIPSFSFLSNKIFGSDGVGNTAILDQIQNALGIEGKDYLPDDLIVDHGDSLPDDILTDIPGIDEEIGKHILMELAEYAGMTLPPLMFIMITLKAIRYFGIFKSIIDREKKFKEMQQKVAQNLSKVVDLMCNKSTTDLENSSLELVTTLKESFLKIQKKSSYRVRRSEELLKRRA